MCAKICILRVILFEFQCDNNVCDFGFECGKRSISSTRVFRKNVQRNEIARYSSLFPKLLILANFGWSSSYFFLMHCGVTSVQC